MSKKVHLILLILIIGLVSGCTQEKSLSLVEQFEQITSGEFTIDEPGVYGDIDEMKEFKGDLYVKVDGVTLQNINITGNLILAEEIGEGDVELNNLNISDTVYIYGGGENSVRYKRTKSKHTLVFKPYKPVRVVVDKESKIDKVTVQSSAVLEGDTILKVSIEPKEENTTVDLKGTFKEVEVKGTTKVVTSEETYIETVVIDEGAENTEVSGDGNIVNVEVNAEEVRINVQVENIYTNNNIEKYMINNQETDLIIDPDEIYHTAETWEVGMPWDPEWGPEPEGAWHPDLGVPWDPAWGPEPDDLDLPEGKESEEGEPEETEGEPEETEGEPEESQEEEQGQQEQPEESEKSNLEFITCNYEVISNPNALEITVSLTKPGTVYYVFEDISVMFGSRYLPSMEQVIRGNNALGSPDPKPEPDTGDEEFEFFSEALVYGQIQVIEAGKEYKVTIYGPTFSDMAGETFLETPTGFQGSFVAVDEEGNKIVKQ